jgi:hypothetical protein
MSVAPVRSCAGETNPSLSIPFMVPQGTPTFHHISSIFEELSKSHQKTFLQERDNLYIR